MNNKYNNKKLLLFGDSIMYGAGNPGFGVGEYLKRDMGFAVAKYCIGGARVGFKKGKNWLIDQVRTAVKRGEEADIIIFDGFTNDCHIGDSGICDVPLGQRGQRVDVFSVNEESDFSQCFESIAFTFKTYFPQTVCLFIRPHKMGKRDGEQQKIYGERAVEICNEYGIKVCDLYNDCDLDTFKPEDRDLYTNDSYGLGMGDCTHPNARGYEEKYMPHIERAIGEIL